MQIIVGLAGGFASKMIDEKGLPFSELTFASTLRVPYIILLNCITVELAQLTPLPASEANKVKFKKEAQLYAARDAKRSVRESGLYENNELEAIDADEKHGAKVI